jgi:hypothetical protein
MSGRLFIGKLDPDFNPFEEDYLAEVLEATVRAWSRMRQPRRNEIEDRITFRLAAMLAHDPEFAEMPYEAIPQFWLLGPEGELLGRLDLRFKHRHSQRDYLAFEAKRLHVTYPGGRFSEEYRTYAGKDGMMAFVEGQYSKKFPAGGMLGYVMDGKSDDAWAGLGRQIESQRTALKLSATCTFAKSTLSRVLAKAMDGSHLGETEHDLETHHLRLFHLLLPVQTSVAQAAE